MTARAPKGLMLFRDREDCEGYLDLLGRGVKERGWSRRSYCLMGNHLHLLVATPEPDLGEGVKRIHERFARQLHLRHSGHGHVFGDRFYSGLIASSGHEVACLRYIARNPVKAGLCGAAEDWPWSAHRALIGTGAAASFLDVDAAFSAITPTGYRRLVATPDATLLDELADAHPDTWTAWAVEEHGMTAAEIARHRGVNVTTIYRHLARARALRG